MRALFIVLLLLLASSAHAQDAPHMAPVQIEWTLQENVVVWFDCWPSDGHTQSDVWVYLVYQEGTAPYVCQPSSELWIRPAPVRRTVEQIKAVN